MFALVLNVLATIWSNPWGRTLLIGIGIATFSFAKGFNVERAMKNREIAALKVAHERVLKEAIAARDSEWQQKLTKANEEHDAILAESIQAAAAITGTNGGRDDLIKLCGSATSDGADCREGYVYRMRGVQKDKVERR